MKVPLAFPTACVREMGRPLHVEGLKGAASAFWIAQHLCESQGPGLIIVPHSDAAIKLYQDLKLLTETERIYLFPPTGEGSLPLVNARRLERAHALSQWLQSKPVWLITWPESLVEPLPCPRVWAAHLFLLRSHSRLDREFLIELLSTYDFIETDIVAEPGQFAWRGAVIDVFSYAHLFPIRLRIEGEEISRIHRFDPEQQVSEGELEEAVILPPPNRLEEQPKSWFSEFLPPEAEIFLVEGQACLAYLSRHASAASEMFLSLAKRGIELGHEPALSPVSVLKYATYPQPSFPHNLELLYEHLRTLPVEKLYLFAESERQKVRLQKLLEVVELPYVVHFVIGSLSQGFYDAESKQAYYTDHQIFRRVYAPPVHRSFRRSEALALRELHELKVGDIVVHKKYGIARFGGLVTIPHSEPPQEGVKLIFADDAALYVPIHQLSDIGRYRAATDTPPKLSKLGTNEWQRTTQRIRRRLKEVAIDLVKLYARRRMQAGYAFSADTLQQIEVESCFPYEETPDQLQATAEVKKDMEAPYPMDRLLCGDVGFGKTEVAVRAAFKATQDGKQVAVLAPTTVLVMQHLRTFQARLEGFPVRIEALTRLQTPKQQREILRKVAAGEIDILIGTHRILSDDVLFRDLGLIIIDEEHKFGVIAKEKLRTRHPTVDTLSMSATPIPRTLQMALSGIREISLITTPPPNRLPVETLVRPFSWELVKEAIEKELSRRGQVFFVHNNIRDLLALTQRIMSLVPTAQVAFIHAKMPGRLVEDILLRFIYQEIDVLVTTNLVEAGLDIPNVNTILINHAHRFGLSDLHQLRGRVGRGGKQAYCYLLVPSLAHLSPEALRRLEALEEFSELGSGFQIAMRDLEIRGAGDLFGKEQSGFIAEIGYDLYQQFLEEAIAQLKEEEGWEGAISRPLCPPLSQCSIECDWLARIPSEWIPYPATRLEIYQRLNAIQDEASLQHLLRELVDRFGPLPEAVLTLADVLRLRWIGDELGLSRIQIHKHHSRLTFSREIDLGVLVKFLDSLRPSYNFRFIPDEKLLIVEIAPVAHSKELLSLLESLGEALRLPMNQ
ncbi:MAG: transcription-repair coupling factor [Bacteroidia bacterium]|nr:transcription-repair coupling factor [Bacteroidia bacterium]MDW8133718.1 transcription-repair coupling factor [Bacteroidia bacterium]